MPDTGPLTTREIDDGWRLDAALSPPDDEPYEEFVLERAAYSGFEEAFWEQCEGRKPSCRFGEIPAAFGKGPKKRAVRRRGTPGS